MSVGLGLFLVVLLICIAFSKVGNFLGHVAEEFDSDSFVARAVRKQREESRNAMQKLLAVGAFILIVFVILIAAAS